MTVTFHNYYTHSTPTHYYNIMDTVLLSEMEVYHKIHHVYKYARWHLGR